MFIVDIYSAIMALVTAIVGSFALVIYLGSKTFSSRVFASLLLITFGWMVCMTVYENTTNYQLANFLSWFLYVLGGMIAAAFFYFCLSFPEDKKPPRRVLIGLVLIQIILFILFYYRLIVYGAFIIEGTHFWGWYYGPLWFLFDFLFDGFWAVGLFILYRKYKNFPAGRAKTHLKFMFWSMVIAIVPPSLVDILLPRLGYFSLNWFGPVTGLGWVSVLAYSVAKYRQMNVKAVAAEVFILVMALVLLVNVFIGEAIFGIVAKFIIFLAFVIIGYIFIKSILKEAEQKEQLVVLNDQLKDLTHNLQQKVDEQTKEVKQAYEVEKKARVELEELDKAKDQFTLATQHHLRTPLTIIKGYLQSFITEKSSSLDEKGRSYLEKASLATDRVANLVNELLDVSQTRVGKSILKKEALNLRTLTEDILNDLSIEIEKRRLSISLTFPPREEDNILNLDKQKMKEALTNLIDNAVKYNHEEGSILVKGEKTHHPIKRDKLIYRLTVEDTGIGITSEELPKLFVQYFERGKEAEKVYTTGKGIGLIITKNIIEAHGGRVWVESEGKGRGARFTAELPV